MKILFVLFTIGAVGASAQSISTVSAPCGTTCPPPASDKMITRTAPSASEGTPCPSLIVSSISGAGNGTVTMTGTPSRTPFKGAANHVAGSVGVAIAAAAIAFAL